MFAFFMDRIIYPVYWALSPRLREHQRNVKIQNDHLTKKVHVVPDPKCWYCQAREQGRRAHG